MDACIAVESEVDKVLSKFGDMRQNYSDVLQQLIDDLETIKNDVTANSINDGKVHCTKISDFTINLFFFFFLTLMNKNTYHLFIYSPFK